MPHYASSFVDFMLYPIHGHFEEKDNQMFIAPFGTDTSEGIDILRFAFLSDNDNRMSYLMECKVGEQESDASVSITEIIKISPKDQELILSIR